MEDNKTLTGVDKGRIHKNIETLTRRLSYLEERFLVKNNSFDGAECAALRHCIWVLTLEMNDQIVLTDVRKTDRGSNTGLAQHERVLGVEESNKASNVILRKIPKSEGSI